MAQIIGTSGAWKSICLELNRAGFHPEKISEIFGLLKTAQEEYGLAKDKNTKEIEDRIAALKTELNNLETSFEGNVKECRGKISAEIELAQITLQLLQDDISFLQRLFNFRKIKKTKKKIRLFQNQYKGCPQKFQKSIDSARKNLEETQRDHNYLIEGKCRIEKYKVDLLERILSSLELAGAIAELELLDSLKGLPDNYYVVSDVNLVLNRGIRFDNEWLASAQIDHVVVCPSGIFIIEVKNWSKKFTQQGDYFDPYQQVKRASYLCYTAYWRTIQFKNQKHYRSQRICP